MPYQLKEDRGKWQVVGPEGKVMGEHATEAKAKAQLAALYANEKDLQKETDDDSIEKAFRRALETGVLALVPPDELEKAEGEEGGGGFKSSAQRRAFFGRMADGGVAPDLSTVRRFKVGDTIFPNKEPVYESIVTGHTKSGYLARGIHVRRGSFADSEMFVPEERAFDAPDPKQGVVRLVPTYTREEILSMKPPALHKSSSARQSLHWLELRKLDEEQHIVEGFATTETPDNQGGTWMGQRYSGDLVTADAVRKALPAYMDWANLREMHQSSAVGTVLKAEVLDGDIEVDGQIYHNPLHIVAKVVDPDAWAKVKAGVYKGFSILGDLLDAVLDKIAGRIVRVAKAITLTEISLVDRPANPGAKILLWKGEGTAAPASQNDEGGSTMTKDTKLSKAAADPQKATTDLQSLRDAAELSGDMATASLYTQAITLLLQVSEAEETPEEEAAETPEEQSAEGETTAGDQTPEGAVPAELAASARGGTLRKVGRTFSGGNAKAMHGVIEALAKMLAGSGDEVAAKVAALYGPAPDAPKDPAPESPKQDSEQVAKLAAGGEEQLRKALEPLGQLEKALGSLTARLEALESQPMPGGPAARAVPVDKTLPGVPATAGEEVPVETMSIEELRKYAATEPDPLQRLDYSRRAWNAEHSLLKKSK